MALLLLRHALAIASAGGDEDVSTFFTVIFLLRSIGWYHYFQQEDGHDSVQL